MKKIENFIEHLECPSVDGIIYSDNTIQLFEVQVSWEKPVEFKVQASSITSVDNIEKEGKLWWSSCAILDEYVDKANSIKVVCGEGGYGSDGFVSVVNLMTEKVIWIAFFTCSNPFCKVIIVEGQIIAFSTIECVWKFNIAKPFIVEVG